MQMSLILKEMEAWKLENLSNRIFDEYCNIIRGEGNGTL